jgi:iron complex transport system substrate-binding protein
VRLWLSGLLCLAVAACAPVAAPHGNAIAPERALGSNRPMKVMSLIACTDQMLVALADRDQIASLSFYSRNPRTSPIAAIAKTLPVNYLSAEDVIATKPDLVLSTPFMPQATRQTLERLSVKVLLFGVPETVDASVAQVREIGAALGQTARAEALIAEILVAAKPVASPRGERALMTYPDGFAAGAGTLVDELMTKAGLLNAAPGYGLGRWGALSLEQMLASPPDVLLVEPDSIGKATDGARLLGHPALKRAELRVRTAGVASSMLYCGGPVIPALAARLNAVAQGGTAS